MTSPLPLSLLADLAAQSLPTRLGGLCPPAVAFAIAALDRCLADDLLLVTATQEEAERLRRDLVELKNAYPGFDRRVLLFASHETSVYEDFSPGHEATGDRMRTLEHLLEKSGRRLVVAPVMGLLRHTLPPELFRAHRLLLKPGGTHDLDAVGRTLAAAGYERLPKVEEPGQFSVRGGILDVFVPGEAWPVRVEFFGDEVESVRLFDPLDQRTLEPIAEASLPPASELVLTPETQDRLLTAGVADPLLSVVAAGGRAQGLERHPHRAA